MSQYLMVDIGAGTMDVLWYDTDSELHFKSVVKSPVRYVAEKAAELAGDLLVSGTEMGGGAVTTLLKERAEQVEVLVSASAAATLHHNPAIVQSWGIEIVEDFQIDDFHKNGKYSHLVLADLDIERLRRIVEGFGVDFEFDAVAICAQDHGVPPEGVSHLDFRHNMFQSRLRDKPSPHVLLYRSDEVPAEMNRLTSIAQTAETIPAQEIFVMDSGMAAILGGTMDVLAENKQRVVILDIATSHTVGAAMLGNEVAGFFEYHTSDITLDRLESLLIELCNGDIAHDRILSEGGHGAYIRKAIGFEDVEVMISTGPKRRLVHPSKLPIVPGAPLGDNMMTGTVGLLEALRRRKGLEPIRYL